MTFDRLSPLDATFLHIEDGVTHMHIASVLVLDGPTPTYEAMLDMIRGKLPLRAALPAGREVRAVRSSAGRCGSTTRTSTSSTTCGTPRCPHPAARPSCAASSAG